MSLIFDGSKIKKCKLICQNMIQRNIRIKLNFQYASFKLNLQLMQIIEKQTQQLFLQKAFCPNHSSTALFLLLLLVFLLQYILIIFILLSHFYPDSLVNWDCSVFNLLKDYLRYFFESILHSVKIFCIYLYEIQTILCCQLLPLRILNLPAQLQVILITHQQNLHVWVPVTFNLLQPSNNMIKCFSTSNIVYQQCPYCTPIVRSSNRPKVFLACSVPNLELNHFISDGDNLGPKLDTNSHIMSLSCLILNKLHNYTRLSNASITNDNEFEEEVVIIHNQKEKSIIKFIILIGRKIKMVMVAKCISKIYISFLIVRTDLEIQR